MFPLCNAGITNAVLSSSSSSPSPPPSEGNPVLLAALSLLFLFRSLSSLSGTAARPSPASLRSLPVLRMRGPSAPPAVKASSAVARAARPAGRALAFSSPESLSDWLRHRLPSDSFASWGVKPGTKTVHNLWLELSLGETSLLLHDADGDSLLQQQQKREEGRPRELSFLRTVHVTTIKIRNARGEMLVETHQLLSDGTTRSRRRPLSEKMKPGESVEEAASRAVREELGGDAKVRIVPGSYETSVEDKASASYPGLPARYVVHSVEAEVEGIPQEGEFSTEESGEFPPDGENLYQKAVFVIRHFWKWIREDDGRLSALSSG